MIAAIAILAFLIVLTYVLYPAFVLLAAAGSSGSKPDAAAFEGKVYVFMAARNEAAVIERTLEALERGNFPPERLVCYIGSDASTDATDAIVLRLKGNARLDIRFRRFDVRQGKPSVINRLVAEAESGNELSGSDLFLMMDANIELAPGFIPEITRAFADPKVGLADGIVSGRVPDRSALAAVDPGVANSERHYLAIESRLKLAEGRLWGCAMGPFGGAYMIRPALFTPVPPNFLVDDFFIFYNILKAGYRSMVVETATGRESVSGDLAGEFSRKRRISAGNFQNTVHFLPEMIRLWKVHNLVFLLHKGLRWLTPLFALGIAVLLAVEASGNPLAGRALGIMICLLTGLPLMNYLLKRLNLEVKWLQGLSYLIFMNVALLAGFFKFLKGVRTNVWEPTHRSA